MDTIEELENIADWVADQGCPVSADIVREAAAELWALRKALRHDDCGDPGCCPDNPEGKA